MAQVGMHEAKTKLSQLVERVEAGEEIIIARNGKPVVRLVPVKSENRLAEVYGALRGQNASLCVAESERLEVPEVITADFVYYRLRKPDYTMEDVEGFAARSKDLLATGRDLYLMFKHEESPEGALNAEQVLQKAR